MPIGQFSMGGGAGGGWQISTRAIIFGCNCLGSNCVGSSFPGGKLSERQLTEEQPSRKQLSRGLGVGAEVIILRTNFFWCNCVIVLQP